MIVAKHAATAAANCSSLQSKRVTPHTLRHTNAMLLRAKGVDIATIALWLGHESVQTTRIYRTTTRTTTWWPVRARCSLPRRVRSRICEAHIAALAGVFRFSRRQVRQLVQDVFGCPISLGAVNATIMQMSVILKDPWEALRDYIQKARLVHADEASWRLQGAQQYLWLAALALAACFRIDPNRSQAAATELLGEEFGGFVVSDRYVGYHFLDVLQQQLCLAHVIRQLTELSERKRTPAQTRGDHAPDPARHPVRAGQPVGRADPLAPRNATPPRPPRARLLIHAATAARHGQPAPSILPAGP